MSKLEDHEHDHVALHMQDVQRWLVKLQQVPGFLQSDPLLEICIDIVSTVEVAPLVDNPPITCDELSRGKQKTAFPKPQLVQ